MIRARRVLCVALGSMLASAAVCQDYPTKPVRIITATSGTSGDFTARLVAQGGLSAALGQPITVDNRGSGALAADPASKAPPDGYTLLVNGPILWISTLLQKASYDAIRDFATITQIERGVNILAVHPSLPVKSVKEMIALARARPGELDYASAGKGSSTHIAGELFKSMAGNNMVHIPYKGSGAAIAALFGGHVHVTFASAGSLGAHMKSGKFRGLAVTSLEPSLLLLLLQDLPTVAAAGLPGFEAVQLTGMWAPTRTPSSIINRIHQEVVRVVARSEVRERFLATGVEPVGSSPEQFAATVQSEIANVTKLIKTANIKF